MPVRAATVALLFTASTALAAPRPPPAADPLPVLACALDVPAVAQVGKPVTLQLRLTHDGPKPVLALIWGTPFEGDWTTAFVHLRRDGTELPYQGPRPDRGEPRHDDYMRLSGGASMQAGIDLAQAFDLSRPGRYELRPQIRLHDLWSTGATRVARPRARHEPQDLDCPQLRFELVE